MTTKIAPRAVDVTITDVTRLKPSDSGSPRYAFTTDKGVEYRSRANTLTVLGVATHVPHRAVLTLDARSAVTEVRYH